MMSRQKDKKTKRQKRQKRQKDKNKRQKRQKDYETKRLTEFYIAMSGQFCTLAMFFGTSTALFI